MPTEKEKKNKFNDPTVEKEKTIAGAVVRAAATEPIISSSNFKNSCGSISTATGSSCYFEPDTYAAELIRGKKSLVHGLVV